MRIKTRVRGLTLSAFAIVTLLSTPAAAPVEAAPMFRDGEPTAAACRAYGYNINDRGENDYRSRMSGGVVGMAPPSPYPPPPPPPPPMAMPQVSNEATAPTMDARRAAPSSPPMVSGLPYSQPPQQPLDTERYPNATSNPIRRVADEPVSTFSIDVDTAAYSNVRRFINDGQRPPRDAVRVEELINYFDYGYARPESRREPFRIYTAVAPSPWSDGRQIIHIGVQGYDLPRTQQPPLNLVFLIDTSGSMYSADKLPLAIKALNVLIDRLRPQDHVSIVAYAGSAGAVLAPTSGRDRLRMRCALGALQAGGSTAGGQGLALAYSLAQQNFQAGAVNRVILMTDGDFNVGVADPSRLKDFVAEKRSSGIYLSVYGFGRGNYNDVMMQTLAQNGNGVAGYIDSLEEARKAFRDDFTASLFPIADDVKIQVEFNPAFVSEYRLIGYETRMLNREDFNNDRVDAGEVGAGASVTALYEITPAGGPRSSDDLRYQSEARPATPAMARGAEIAFVKLRYKRPGEATSNLITQAVGAPNIYGRLDAAPEQTRWAVAVAAYGQLLRGDPWLRAGFGWPQVTALAQGARGEDPDGLRAEFVRLTRSAGEGRSVNE